STDVEIKLLNERFNSSRMPVASVDIEDYVDGLYDQVIRHSINTSSPRYVGHMTAGVPHFAWSLGKLITALNQNLVKSETSKSLTPLERQALAMMHRLVYAFSDDFYDGHTQNRNSTLGIMTSGGTLANITAVWCARNALLRPDETFQGIEK